MFKTVEWNDGRVIMVDQTRLPSELTFVQYDDYRQVAHAIKTLVVRGAPAIGVAGAFGLALAAAASRAQTKDELYADLKEARDILQATRPTAVNLKWGLDRMMAAAEDSKDADSARRDILEAAKKMASDDITANMAMGRIGAELFGDRDTIMTHCNAGALATVAYGTALGVIRAAKESGKDIRVIATETRPVQQGSRLTAFELQHDNIDVSLIPDTAVGYTMANRLVDKVIVGADRILRTGHVYNKIGTFQIATMARACGIPFYVAAPLSTFDMKSTTDDVVIEQRRPDELTGTGTARTAPEGVQVINPAFDLTPPELITGIITERGIVGPPYAESIGELFKANK